MRLSTLLMYASVPLLIVCLATTIPPPIASAGKLCDVCKCLPLSPRLPQVQKTDKKTSLI